MHDLALRNGTAICCHKLSQLSLAPVLKSSCLGGTHRTPFVSSERTMGPRFRVIETTRLEDGSKRYRVVDLVEGGSASKHGVFEVRAEAETVCSTLNTEHPRQTEIEMRRASPVSTH